MSIHGGVDGCQTHYTALWSYMDSQIFIGLFVPLVQANNNWNIDSSYYWWPADSPHHVQYIPRNMHTVFALLCFVVVIHWLIFPYPSGLIHWHCGNLTIAPVPAKQPWWIWINTSCEFIMNDCITTTKQSTTKPCAYFLGYTVMRKAFPCHNVLEIPIYYNHIADIHVTYI